MGLATVIVDQGKHAEGCRKFGDLAFLRGDYAECEQRFTRSLEEFEALSLTWAIALSLDLLGYLACH